MATDRRRRTLGSYEVLSTLGRGGMATVYLGRSLSGQLVAIKLLNLGASSAIARFERERRLVTMLGQEQGFVPLIEVGWAGSTPYFVMPFFPGGTLRRLLQRGPLDLVQAVGIVRRLALALGRAHERGIVHRDVKPENVLFDGRGRPHVADLGVGKHFRRDLPGASASRALTESGSLIGTVAYMAPEQARDAANAGPAADVYGLGAILYECLAGELPVRGATEVELLARLEHGSVLPIDALRPDVPRWLARVVHRALARDPRERYADGIALAEALAEGELVPAPVVERAPSRLRGVAAAAVVLAVLAAGRASADAPPRRELEPLRLAPAMTRLETQPTVPVLPSWTPAPSTELRTGVEVLPRVPAAAAEVSTRLAALGVTWEMSEARILAERLGKPILAFVRLGDPGAAPPYASRDIEAYSDAELRDLARDFVLLRLVHPRDTFVRVLNARGAVIAVPEGRRAHHFREAAARGRQADAEFEREAARLDGRDKELRRRSVVRHLERLDVSSAFETYLGFDPADGSEARFRALEALANDLVGTGRTREAIALLDGAAAFRDEARRAEIAALRLEALEEDRVRDLRRARLRGDAGAARRVLGELAALRPERWVSELEDEDE